MLRTVSLALGLFAIVSISSSAPAYSDTDVWTYKYDNQRSGANVTEKMLTPSTVRDSFGYRFKFPVDGDIYAQPLIVSGVKIGDTLRTLLIVATEHDTVYAFDANADVANLPIWRTSFLGINPPAWHMPLASPVVVTPVPILPDDNPLNGCADIQPEIGITGTPVIAIDPSDRTRSVIYVVAKTKEVSGGHVSYVQRLHALDITTGKDTDYSPVTIAATVNGTGHGGGDLADHLHGEQGDNDGKGHIVFDALHQHQRAGLLLLNGVVYVAWGGHCDGFPYHGWILGYDAATLKIRYVFNSTPNAGEGGIWQAGAAPAADDAGSIYVTTGNGAFDPANSNFGDSLLKLRPDGTILAVADYFTPCNEADLGGDDHGADMDIGSWGPLVLPDQAGEHKHLVVSSGKEGIVYVVDSDAMGKNSADGDHIVQRLPDYHCPRALQQQNNMFGSATYWNSGIYFMGVPLTALGAKSDYTLTNAALTNGLLGSVVRSHSNLAKSQSRTSPVVSSAGEHNAVVWIIELDHKFRPVLPPVLYALSADLTTELYVGKESDLPAENHEHGIKFSIPTVANGRVYVGTSGAVYVYGTSPKP